MLPPIPTSPSDAPSDPPSDLGLDGEQGSAGAAILAQLVGQIDRELLPQDLGTALAGSPAGSDVPEGNLLGESTATAVESREGEGVLHVVFRLGRTTLAVPGALLAEIKPYGRPIPIPGVPHWLQGIESYQGETLSVVDLAAFLGCGALAESATARLMVIYEPGSRRRVLTGFAVDSVATHAWLPETDGGADLSLAGRLGSFTDCMLELDGRTLAVLDLEALLQSDDFRELVP